MTVLKHRAVAWLPEGAANYAAQLTGLKGEGQIRQFSSTSLGDVTFDNGLSERILLDRRMKEVWEYLAQIHDEHEWFRFLTQVQIATKYPSSESLRSPAEKLEDLATLEDAFKKIEYISKRYGIDATQTPVGSFFDNPDLIISESDSAYAVRGGNEVTIMQYFDALRALISKKQMLIKKPGHRGIKYQYFVRFVYLNYFKANFNKPNQWKKLSIIASVSLEERFLPDKVKGTCQDLK